MKFVIILIIAIFVLSWCWPTILRWTQRRMLRNMEDALRSGMGMPSRKEEQKMRRKSKDSRQDPRRQYGKGAQRASTDQLMHEVAEDVDFVEIRQFESSETVIKDTSTGETEIEIEQQVEDAVFVEIKTPEK